MGGEAPGGSYSTCWHLGPYSCCYPRLCFQTKARAGMAPLTQHIWAFTCCAAVPAMPSIHLPLFFSWTSESILLHVCQGRPCQRSWCDTWIWSHKVVASETSSKLAVSVPPYHVWPGPSLFLVLPHLCDLCDSDQVTLAENTSPGKQQFTALCEFNNPLVRSSSNCFC